MRYHLKPLSEKETNEYIQKRLQIAGAKGPLFTNGAVREVYRSSGGIPRLINILCDNSLLNGYSSDQRVIDTKLVKEAARDLSLKKRLRIDWFRILVGVLIGSCILLSVSLQQSGKLGAVVDEILVQLQPLKETIVTWASSAFK